MPRFLAGTSGFSYPHWRAGVFYPEGLKQAEELEYYASVFGTVELNTTFYRLPGAGTFEAWRDRTPPGFRFAVKGSRYITHVKRLKDPAEPVRRFLDHASRLGRKLEVVLWQLRPDQKADLGRLESICDALATDAVRARHAFEFRNESWFSEPVYELLRRRRFAAVLAHSPTWRQPDVVTAPFVYLRFHGGERLYDSEYTKGELAGWAKLVRRRTSEGLDVYAYFNNDPRGYAVRDASRLRELVGNV